MKKQNKLDIKGLHHIAIICSDYAKSKKFYTDVLGFNILKETYRKERDSYKLDLILGLVQIELFSFPNPPKRMSFPESTGLRHVAFRVNDIEKICKTIIQMKIPVEPIRVDPITGKKFTFFFDPDQLPIELYQE